MATCGSGATFDWSKLQVQLWCAPWEDDPEEPSQQRRTVWLGTIFALTPSGKMYQPFACSNVAGDCPVCGGEGTIVPRTGKRVRARAKRRQHDFARGTIKRGTIGDPAGRAYADRVHRFRHAAARVTDLTCHACNGLGSISAAKDERWNEELEKSAEKIGAFVWYFDDSIYIAQSRERAESEGDGGEAV